MAHTNVRTEGSSHQRPHVMSHVNQWLAASHPGVYARMPGDGGPLGPKPSTG